ncbi:hypothetical protein JHS3_03080 [Jeongeupia sp. HS-3]|uniref:peroxidase family protein n=1 Tax=Jeongeupia sp. HS-3 TaxID=1009682 RepID=UPI0018A6783F|nr:peroxidase family protein [Jeongeupia sp. HS-3]BCL74572.1 hypothetical protein JHS3_03080 [Jeongeupia sp. HS-3]
MITLNKADLEFILRQIHIAEAHSAGGNLADLVGNSMLPHGLRTVSGIYNNLMPGQAHYGSADQIMLRLLDPEFRAEYFVTTGVVRDSEPRTISNLISDQTASNPAAVGAAGDNPAFDLNGSLLIENVAADEGLSAPFNGWMTLFGQFFDHGLDLVNKGGSGVVMIPLLPDDPLYVEGAPNFMMLTRATNQPGADGVLGTDDDVREHVNQTTPFIDQNQTYTSSASHQVFLREYALDDGKPVATGLLLDGSNGGLATWADVKEQGRTLLGIDLTDADVTNVPQLLTDEYGMFIRGPNGYAQMFVVNAEGNIVLVEGNPDLPVSTAMALRTGHAFLDDIAHAAAPKFTTINGQRVLNADNDTETGMSNGDGTSTAGKYDNELLDRHFITGDGRGNENIGLTTVHHVFHSEHNRLVEQNQGIILQSGDLAFLNSWLRTDVDAIPTDPAAIAALEWDGERLFQAARFANEMQYQHLVFEEFARTVAPNVDLFVFTNSVDINPAIVAEFAHVVYRFGHSMLTETIARLDSEMNDTSIDLIQGFLNPIEFDRNGTVSADEAAGAIIRGMTRQVGNEIDEFVTEALRNNLVGLPLDLAALNIARARETGVPSLNHARAQFYEMTGDTQLRPYTSWVDFAQHIKNPASVINFIAAYGTHESITGADTLDAKRAAATLLVTGGAGAPADRVEYLNGTGDRWSNTETGLNNIDLWIGGLAEEKMPFGGMLGSTFTFVFEAQMEKLQAGDRFYYLSRTQGMNLLNELEGNSFAELVMANTDLGRPGSSHLPGSLFQAVEHILEMDQSLQIGADPTGSDPILEALSPLVVRKDLDGDGDLDVLEYHGGSHIVLGGTEEDDRLISGDGDDTVWGDGGNDRIEGGYGVDHLFGGAGDDYLTDRGVDVGEADVIKGGAGNDIIHGGNGLDLLFGNDGNDFIVGGSDSKEIFAGEGNDFILGSSGASLMHGNEGDDWIEGGDGFDTLAGENSELFFNSPVIGHDVLFGGGNDSDYDAESGDDIMVQGLGIHRNEGMFGFDWVIHKGMERDAFADLEVPIFATEQADILRNRFDQVEGLSGWKYNDTLIGDDRSIVQTVPELTLDTHVLTQEGIDRIAGLRQLLGLAPAATDARPDSLAYAAGNVLLGGAGSDRIEGRGADDFIDGDAWLNVRIGVRDPANPAVDIASYDWLKGELQQEILAGRIKPEQLHIIREILGTDNAAREVDTAVFSEVMDNYTITRNDDGTMTVAHTGGTLLDGVDTLQNIERLQFADQTVRVAGDNALPDGEITLSDTSPSMGQTLTANFSGVTDADGIVAGSLRYEWQVFTDEGVWATIGSGPNFTPGATVGGQNLQIPLLGQPLRVIASFIDGQGAPERVVSAQTAPINQSRAASGQPVIDATTPAEDQVLTASLGNIVDPDGINPANVTFIWEAQNADGSWREAATGPTFQPGDAEVGQALRVVASFIDNQGNTERLTSDITAPVSNINDLPTGLPAISNPSPSEDELLTIDTSAIVDADGMSNATLAFQWQVGNGDSFSDIPGATTASFAPGDAHVGQQLRVIVRYTDDRGQAEEIISAATTAVANVNDAPTGVLALSDATPTEGQVLSVSTSDIADADGMAGVTFSYQWQLGGSGGFTDIAGATGASFTPGQAQVGQQLRVVVRYTDQRGTQEVLTSVATAVVGDQITGTGANNTLNGTAGADIILGMAGNDTLNGLDGDDMLSGGTGSDALNGGNGNDQLLGEAGADTLNGGAGADTMAGGAGNDSYVVDDAADSVTEGASAGDGNDLVQTSLSSYTLGNNVEQLSYTGTGNFTGTGNALANRLSGGSGNDVLNGGAGADTMIGGAGNDTYYVDVAGDVITETANGGIDTVMSTLGTYTLANNVETLVHIGSNGATLSGNAGANRITGGAAADNINGGDGDDIIEGGGGNDVMTGGAGVFGLFGGGNDTFVFSAPSFGQDRINNFDANVSGGQELLDISSLGISTADFTNRVQIEDLGNDTRVTIGADTIVLVGVNGTGTNAITQSDFILAG